MIARAFAIVVVAALWGCKTKASVTADSALGKMQEFASEVCRCTDKACADRVQEDLTRWADELAKKGKGTDEKPSEAVMRAIMDAGKRYAECMTVAMTNGPGSASDSGSGGSAYTPRPPPNLTLSTPSDRPPIAKLVQEAKEYTRAAEDDLVIHILRARYVSEDGELDPTYGELVISFGNRLQGEPRIEDDPDRPTGAPFPEPTVPPPPKRPDSAMCPDAIWTAKTGWTWNERSCFGQSALTPKCSTADVWKLAKADKGAEIQGKAVAIIELVRNSDESQSWEFSIRDALRKVDISARIPDTCTPIAEKP